MLNSSTTYVKIEWNISSKIPLNLLKGVSDASQIDCNIHDLPPYPLLEKIKTFIMSIKY